MPSNPIQSPASYVPSHAAAFADIDGTSILVSNATPLPVALSVSGSAPAPLAGLAAASTVVGPFQPTVDRSVMLVLSGTWTGTVRLLRSTDGGTTKLPVTVAGSAWAQYTANCCEPAWEEADAAARLYLDLTIVSGTLIYRLAQ